MAIGEVFLSAFLQVLFDRLVSDHKLYDSKTYGIVQEFLDECGLETLKEILLRIRRVINDAEAKQINDEAVRMWLHDLQHLAYDTEDLLEELEYEFQRFELEANDESSTSQVLNLIPSSLRRNNFMFNYNVSSKIKEITGKLEKIAGLRDNLNLREGVVVARSDVIRQRLPTGPLVSELPVLGREEDFNKILELLLSNESGVGGDDEVFSVIPIVGLGGVGKTTLAQLLYNHEDVNKHFDLKAWAYVSDDFDVVRVTKEIIELADKGCKLEGLSLSALQVHLQDTLKEKRYLLVLDDFWSENREDWLTLSTPFRAGKPGSKVIVTTRIKTVSSNVGTVTAYSLNVLSNKDCWSLFEKHAFVNGKCEGHPNLEVIGRKIMKKCQGLPLAVKTLGGLLRSKLDEDEWKDILNSQVWALPDDRSDILPSLRLSYHHLPSNLKRCFAYCSIFPKDYEFDKDLLVLLWMAEGLLRTVGNKRMEDVGDKYFRELISRSFFQESSRRRSLFLMHDLINDLARFVSGDTVFKLEDWLEGDNSYKISLKARYSSYHRDDLYDLKTKFDPFYSLKCLRTFLPLTEPCYPSCLPNQVPHDLLSSLRCLGALSLSGYEIIQLPDSIGELKLLRYIDLSYCPIEELPESIHKLYNLQTLILNECSCLKELVKDVGNLINLRHLRLPNWWHLKKMPLRIGRLTNLQTLNLFVVDKHNGSCIRELKDMLQLRGDLCILGLENVVNAGDSIVASLQNKKYLQKLKLRWREGSQDDEIAEQILDGLEPPITNLEKLIIEGYTGPKFPSWFEHMSHCCKLSVVKLYNCGKCKLLPALGLLPFLKDLCIKGLHGVKTVGHEFYGYGLVKPSFRSLKKLRFTDMKEWEEWCAGEGNEEFPRLCELCISRCPMLWKVCVRFPALEKFEMEDCSRELSIFPRSFPLLRELELNKCGETVLRSVERTTPSSTLTSLSIGDIRTSKALSLRHLTSLQSLNIFGCQQLVSPRGLQNLLFLRELIITKCHNIVSFPEELPSMLSRLVINSCEKLKSLPVGLLHNTNTSLEYLKISRCDSFKSFSRRGSGLPITTTKLKDLCISECQNLESLPEALHNLTLLSHLEIMSCPCLVSFPEGGLPITNLNFVGIHHCEKLMTLPVGMHNLTSLQKLSITSCDSLESFPESGLPITNLRSVRIINCSRLESLPDGMHNLMSLQNLYISNCDSLESFPESGLPITNLCSVRITNCSKLKSLPDQLHMLTSLEELTIEELDDLLSFPESGLPITNLRSVKIRNCKKLKSLPNRMHTLMSLQKLSIEGCCMSVPEGGFPPKLESLEIMDFGGLSFLSKLGLHRLVSLRSLRIGGCPGLVAFFGVGLPTTLEYLDIAGLPDLQFPPGGLDKLTSLKQLCFSQCDKLESLPEEGLPPMLGCLIIEGCAMLERRCQKNGEDWDKIAHIPCLQIDGEVIH